MAGALSWMYLIPVNLSEPRGLGFIEVDWYEIHPSTEMK
jgi:hypothetical protein